MCFLTEILFFIPRTMTMKHPITAIIWNGKASSTRNHLTYNQTASYDQNAGSLIKSINFFFRLLRKRSRAC